MAYSLDLRKKVIEYRNTDALEEICKTFGISKTTILDWEKFSSETGSLEKRHLNRTFKKIDPAELAKIILEEPDLYLSEIAERFGCSATAVFYALENEKNNFKKTEIRYSEANEKE
ncbi:MAG: IS630 transposase-related protein [Clostridia bacterium]